MMLTRLDSLQILTNVNLEYILAREVLHVKTLSEVTCVNVPRGSSHMGKYAKVRKAISSGYHFVMKLHPRSDKIA